MYFKCIITSVPLGISIACSKCLLRAYVLTNAFLLCKQAKEVVKHWYHGGAMRYDYSLHPEVLHTQGAAFSQLVWRDSTDLGIGKAHSLHNEAKVRDAIAAVG